jgi:hypothetical protein
MTFPQAALPLPGATRSWLVTGSNWKGIKHERDIVTHGIYNKKMISNQVLSENIYELG